MQNIVWKNDKDRWNAINERKYQADWQNKFVKKVSPKADGKFHQYKIPTQFDKAVQTLYSFGLIPIAECQADSRSYAFRP